VKESAPKSIANSCIRWVNFIIFIPQRYPILIVSSSELNLKVNGPDCQKSVKCAELEICVDVPYHTSSSKHACTIMVVVKYI